MLNMALKEWAVICRALAEGQQTLLLRKGGLAETGGEFRVEHARFWLLPTYFHERQAGIRAEAAPLLAQAEADRPPEGILRLSHFAEVARVGYVHDLSLLEQLARWHCWSQETVEKRFAYRRPGLFVLAVRVFAVPRPYDLPNEAAYEGCQSWVELRQELSTDGATAVLDDVTFGEMLRTLEKVLGASTSTQREERSVGRRA